MSYTISCYVLFDVTPSRVASKYRADMDAEMVYQRNTQCNFDTILQVISLRSQPEVTKYPEKIEVAFDDDRFGFLFEAEEDKKYPCWVFEFEIMHHSVFDDGVTELGALYSDCDNVPMIKCGTEWTELPSFIDSTDELRNIYFKVENDKTDE